MGGARPPVWDALRDTSKYVFANRFDPWYLLCFFCCGVPVMSRATVGVARLSTKRIRLIPIP